jgi:hypothetical protein
MLGEEKVATNLAASFGLGEVGAITVIVQDHVAGVIANDSIRIRCCIVQEVDDDVESGLSGLLRITSLDERFLRPCNLFSNHLSYVTDCRTYDNVYSSPCGKAVCYFDCKDLL